MLVLPGIESLPDPKIQDTPDYLHYDRVLPFEKMPFSDMDAQVQCLRLDACRLTLAVRAQARTKGSVMSLSLCSLH